MHENGIRTPDGIANMVSTDLSAPAVSPASAPAPAPPRTARATARLATLLVALCVDGGGDAAGGAGAPAALVAEQMRPYLPGLLSLAAAAYPPRAAPVAAAALAVVEALCGGLPEDVAAEIAGLEGDAEIPIEELRKRMAAFEEEERKAKAAKTA